MVCQKICRGRCSQCRMLLLVCSLAHSGAVPVTLAAGPETSGIQDRVPCIPVVSFSCTDLPYCRHSSRLRVRSSPPALIYGQDSNGSANSQQIWVIEALLLQDLVYGTVCLLVCVRSLAMDNLGDIWKLIYSGIEKSQRRVTYDFWRYINNLTYLLTYLRDEKRDGPAEKREDNKAVLKCMAKPSMHPAEHSRPSVAL